MAYGNYEGKDLNDPELRKQFNREYVIQSDWYKDRLKLKQQKDIDFLKKQIQYLNDFKSDQNNQQLVHDMKIHERIKNAGQRLHYIESADYMKDLEGTIGADPLFK